MHSTLRSNFRPVSVLVMIVVGMLLVAGTAQAQSTRIWNKVGGGNWDNDANWNAAKPAGGDSVMFGPTGAGAGNTMDIADLALNTFTVSNAHHSTDLDGNTLTADTLLVYGIGASVSGRLDIANGTIKTTTLRTGLQRVADNYITLANNAVMEVGTDTSNRGQVLLGDITEYQQISFVSAGTSLGNWFLTDFDVGRANVSSVANGGFAQLDLTAVTTPVTIDVSRNLRVGAIGRSSCGRLLLSNAIDLKLGSPSARASILHVGGNHRDSSLYLPAGYAKAADLIMGTGKFEVYVTNLWVATDQNAVAMINATNCTSGMFDVSKDIRFGNTDYNLGSIRGNVLIGNAIPVKLGSLAERVTVNAHHDFIFTTGTNTFEAYINNLFIRTRGQLNLGQVQSGVLDVSGDFTGSDLSNGGLASPLAITLSDGFRTKIGDESARVKFSFLPSAESTTQDSEHTFKAGGAFNAWLSEARIGSGSFDASRRIYVTMDLSSVTGGTFNVAGDMVLGNPGATRRTTVVLPAMVASAQNLTMGTTNRQSNNPDWSQAKLIMTGTVFSVSGNVTMTASAAGNRSEILTTLTGASGGLDLGSDATLTVGNGLIHITFSDEPDNPAEVYWGLRWAGHHVTELKALADAGKLTWDASAIAPATVSIFKADGYTYVGAFDAPVIEVWPATEITDVSATINGRMAQLQDWDGDDVDVYFCWGTADELTATTSDWQNVVFAANSPAEGTFLDTPLTGLDYGVPVFYRLYATNHTVLDETWSYVETFTPVVHPTVELTAAATNIGRSRAYVQAEVTDDGGQAPLYGFAWWKSASASTSTVALGTGKVAFDYVIEGLDGESTYYYYAWASNVAGRSTSATNSFETLPVALADYTWTGNTSTDWFTDTNWSPVGIPDTDDRAMIGSGKTVVLNATTPTLGSLGVTNATLILTNWTATLNATVIDLTNGTLILRGTVPAVDGMSRQNRINAGTLRLAPTEFRVVEGDHEVNLGSGELRTPTFRIEGTSGSLDSNRAADLIMTNGSVRVSSVAEIGVGLWPYARLTLAEDVNFLVGQNAANRANRLQIGTSTANSQTNDVVVTGSGPFNAYVTNMIVGASGGSSATRGRSVLDLSAVTDPSVLDVSGNAMIGAYYYGKGDLLLSDSVDLKIGTPTTRAGNLSVGESARSGEVFTPHSRLILGQGGFDAYVTNLNIGFGGELSSGLVHAVSAHGVLNVSGAVKLGTTAAAVGTLLLGDGMDVEFGSPSAPADLHIGGYSAGINSSGLQLGAGRIEAHLSRFEVNGFRAGGAGSYDIFFYAGDVSEGILNVDGPFTVSAQRFQAWVTATHTITLGNNFVTRIGSPSTPVAMKISDGFRPAATTFKAGGTFNAYLTELAIARNTDTAEGPAPILFDLSGVTNGTMQISGSMIVATGYAGRATVKLPAIDVSVARLQVGSSGLNSTGIVMLAGTRFGVTQSVALNAPTAAAKSEILTTVSGTSGGLDLASGATLTVGNGLIHITFAASSTDRTSFYWGLRWAGSKTAALQTLINDGKLTWDDSAVPFTAQIHEDSTYTYIGTPPPRGTLMIIR